MRLSRRRFLDAAAALAVASPLKARAGAGAAREPEDAVALAQAVREGRATPLALVDRAIARLEAVNPKINSVHSPNRERARAQARAGVTGPLSGVPTLIKDNTAQKGLPNTNALRLFLAPVAERDDPYVVAMEAAGLISIGRSTLPELASNVTTESALTGITRNPWALDRVAGGSSGGAAAAVAAGVVPVAHGNDAAGSIRHAAAPCGLVGLKPSRGRMAGDEQSRDVSQQMVHGPLSRTVRDAAAWFAATESHQAGAPFSPVGLVSRGPARRLKIGVRAALPRSGAMPSRAVQAVFDASATLLARLGHDVRPADLAYDGPKAANTYVELWEARMSRFLVGLAAKLGRPLTPADIETRLLGMGDAGRDVSDARMAECLEVLRAESGRYAAQFEALDVYMTPVFSTEPLHIGDLAPTGAWRDQRDRLAEYAGYCWIDNLAGTPAITLPMGWSRKGLPIGIQFSAGPGGERTILELAYQLEAERRWWTRRPPIWAA